MLRLKLHYPTDVYVSISVFNMLYIVAHVEVISTGSNEPESQWETSKKWYATHVAFLSIRENIAINTGNYW